MDVGDIEHGLALATVAATRSRELDEHAARVGEGPPLRPTRGGDEEYRQAWRRERLASEVFWTWAKTYGAQLVDADLGRVLRVLAGHPDSENLPKT